MIVDAPTDDFISTSLNVGQNFSMTTHSKPLNKTGHMIKFVIAAKFNHSAPSGWPVLHIRRNDSINNKLTMTQREPIPTGYLNVFEYDLLSADVQPGDVVHIQSQSYEQRYLLAYQILSSPFQPQVYVNVSNNNDGATNEIPHNNKTVKSSTTDSPTTNIVVSYESDSVKEQSVIVITSSVLGTLVILILLALLIIIMFLIYQRKRNAKRFSPNTNTGVSTNVSSGALENVYISDNMLQGGNQMIPKACGDGADICAGTDNEVSHQNNPQEVSLLAVQ